MNITEKDYNKISDTVYWIDPKHKNYQSSLKENSFREIGGKDYKILKIQENSKTDGMQAMAVAPIDKNGNVDTSNVVIAYAGTNSSDLKDLETDVRSVMNFFDKTASPGLAADASSQRTSGQVESAKAFAKEIKDTYKNATITTTGHSLGEFLGLYIAAENGWRNVGFNGPDPYDLLSDQAKQWIKDNPGMLTNYRNRGDGLGNFGGNGTGAEVRISMTMGMQNPLNYHELSIWQFDEEGKLIIPDNEYNQKARQQQAERQLVFQFALGMADLNALKVKLTASGGGLSNNEKMYLDDSQAKMVVEMASQAMKLNMEKIIIMNQKLIQDVEKIWRDGLARARGVSPDLSESEMVDQLASVRITKTTVVDEPKREYEKKIAKAKKMGEQFDTLTNEIKTKIAELVQRDQELAQQLTL